MLSYRLREAMDIRKKTQEKLAAETNVSQSHISRILNGEREPTVDIAMRLAYALDVSLDWLCGMPPAPDAMLAPDEGELLDSYRAIEGKAARTIALNVIREMGGLK